MSLLGDDVWLFSLTTKFKVMLTPVVIAVILIVFLIGFIHDFYIARDDSGFKVKKYPEKSWMIIEEYRDYEGKVITHTYQIAYPVKWWFFTRTDKGAIHGTEAAALEEHRKNLVKKITTIKPINNG